MQTMLRRLVLGLGVACVTGLVFGLVLAAGLGTAAAITAGALVGGAAAGIVAIPAPGPVERAPPLLSGGTTVGAQGAAATDPLSQLRHDLRGVLSPALLTADRLLASSDDPAARRAAETMIETVERATALLATPRRSGPDATA